MHRYSDHIVGLQHRSKRRNAFIDQVHPADRSAKARDMHSAEFDSDVNIQVEKEQTKLSLRPRYAMNVKPSCESELNFLISLQAGADVCFAGHIGSDGEWLKETLAEHGVDTSYLRTDDSVSLELNILGTG